MPNNKTPQAFHCFVTLIMLTRPDGLPVYLRVEEIMSVQQAVTGHKAAKTEIVVHDRVYYVLESVEEVIDKIKSAAPP